MTAHEQRQLVGRLILDWFVPRPTGSPAKWAVEHLVIPAPQTPRPGRFSFSGCEYLAEPVECFGVADVNDVVLCFGSQSGKTTAMLAGLSWTLAVEPSGVLWVLPNDTLAKNFSQTRWQPIIEATEELAVLVPKGAERHDYARAQQILGGSVVNFVGSNSPANLSSRPARLVILDETDKFPVEGRGGEADAITLAEQRTKGFSNAKRFKTSTPTLDTGAIWQEFEKGDQRRWFVPCPLCGKFVVFAWSPTFSTLPKTGNEAYIRWDSGAKGRAGVWDLTKVERSAHAECPHCKGAIRDEAKTKMNRAGEWRPTTTGSYGFRSYHLPSICAASPQTSFGRLAVAFLQAKRSLLGLQGFINGTLAEPYRSQETVGERTELVSRKLEVTGDWKKILTVDCQARAPYFWYVVRAWTQGRSEAVAAGSLDTWEEVERVQREHAIPDVGVIIDAGFGARSDADVYAACMRHCELVPRPTGGLPYAVGWQPSRGFASRKRWRDEETGLWLPYYLRPLDPFLGTAHAGEVSMSLFEFSADFFKDILDMLRRQEGRGHQWSVHADVATETYWQHLDGEVKDVQRNPKTGKVSYGWKRRSSRWPNHIFDAEVLQLASAASFGLLDLGPVQEGDGRDARETSEEVAVA